MNSADTTRRDVAWLLLLCVPLFFVGLGSYDLDLRGEPREGITAWETIHSNFLLPLLNGERLPEKPLMFPWLMSVPLRLFGETSEWAARLVSALMGVGLVLVTRAIGARLLGARGGLTAAAATAGTFLVVSLARRARVDMTLTFFVCVALLQFVALWQEHESDPNGRPSQRRLVVLWLAVACATLTKGPLGAVLPALAIGAFLIARWRIGFAWTLLRSWSVLLFVALAGGWYAYGLFSAGERFGFRTFLMENVLMFLGDKEGGGHRQPPWYFVPQYFFFGAPWAFFLPAAATLVVRRARGAWAKESLLFPLAWFVAMFLFFSAASGKRSDYLLPLLPAAALLVAGALESAPTTGDAFARRFVAGTSWTVAALGVVVACVAAALVWAPASSLPAVIAEKREGAEGQALFAVVERHAATTVALLVGIAVIAAAPAFASRAKRPAFGVGVAAATMAIVAPLGLVTYMPVFREHDSLKSFTAQMLETAGDGATIRSWNDFEPQVFFYANRRLPPIARETDDRKTRDAALDAYLAEPGVGWVFSSRGDFDALSPARRARFEVVVESHRTDRSAPEQCVLLRRSPR